jgi:hypothetical protein
MEGLNIIVDETKNKRFDQIDLDQLTQHQDESKCR